MSRQHESRQKAPYLGSGKTNELYFESSQEHQDQAQQDQNSAFLGKDGSDHSQTSPPIGSNSYYQLKKYLQRHTLPPRQAIHIEELVNYIPYEDPEPYAGKPFGLKIEISEAPWAPQNRLVKISIKAKKQHTITRRSTHLFVAPQFSKHHLQQKTKSQVRLIQRSLLEIHKRLDPNDRVTLVNPVDPIQSFSYTGSDPVTKLVGQLDHFWQKLHQDFQKRDQAFHEDYLEATFEYTRSNYSQDSNNRVVVLLDGSDDKDLQSYEQIEQLSQNWSIEGFDVKTVIVSEEARPENFHIPFRRASFYFIHTKSYAKTFLMDQFSGDIGTVAENVDIRLKFNPLLIDKYQLIGFDNEKSVAQSVKNWRYSNIPFARVKSNAKITAFYELIPTQRLKQKFSQDKNREIFQLKLSYKEPTQTRSELLFFPVYDKTKPLTLASKDFRFGAAVIAFGKALQNPAFLKTYSMKEMQALAKSAIGNSKDNACRLEMLGFMELAADLDGIWEFSTLETESFAKDRFPNPSRAGSSDQVNF